jgi:hypothetical protein
MNVQNPRAVIGANNPPDPIDTITALFEGDRAEAEGRLDGKPVENEAQMKEADQLRATMRDWRLALEKGQKSATAPLYDIYKAELERWKPTIEDSKRIEAGLVGIVDGFKRKLANEKAEADRIAQAAAWELTRKAQEAARLADATNIEATRAAAAAIAQAEAAQKAAAIAAKDTVKGMRTVTKYEITDHRALLNYIAKNARDDMTAFIEVWAQKHHKEFANADGLRVWSEKEAY